MKSKRPFRLALAALILVLSQLAALPPAQAVRVNTRGACTGDDRRTVSTEGQATVYVNPDRFTVVAGVETYDKNLASAYARNGKVVEAVLGLAKKYKLPAGTVQTDYISVHPEYDRSNSFHKGDKVIEAFHVSKRISMKLDDPKAIGPLIEDLISLGVNSISKVSFERSNLREHADKARQMALKAAQEKASLLANELGMKVGKAVWVSEDSTSSGGYSFFPNLSNNVSFQQPGDMEASDGIALGQIPVKARVNATFELAEE